MRGGPLLFTMDPQAGIFMLPLNENVLQSETGTNRTERKKDALKLASNTGPHYHRK